MNDRVMRAITLDGGFRVMVANTTALVQEGVRLQKVEGSDARVFGELLTGAVLVRETMAPGHRVQAILTREGHGTMIADSHPDEPEDLSGALTRGLVSRTSAGLGQPIPGVGALLKVVRSLPRGRLHQSIVEAGGSDMGQNLMRYLQDSAQIYATLGVATVVDGGRVIASGGFIVQLLPELADGPLAVMTERLDRDFRALDALLVEHHADPKWLLDELLYGFPHEVLSDGAVRWGCDCSIARVLGAVVTLGREELDDILAKAEVLSLTCEYCTRIYQIGPEQIRALLVPS